MENVQSAPSCEEAAWRFAGISLAGYSALISAALATISALSVFKAKAQTRAGTTS
jgi:disulfide bond formation protein DsbB